MTALCCPAEYLSRETTYCPTCKADRNFAGRTALWYGITVSCTSCGDSWTDGELHERPFRRAWRTQAIADAQGSTSAIPWIGLFSPVTLIDGVQSAFLGAIPALPGEHGPSNGQGVVYILAVLGLIASSYGLLMRRYKKVGL